MSFTTENPHRAFLVICGLICCVVTFGLVAGWKWHVQYAQAREAIVRFAEEKEALARKEAAAVMAAEIAPEQAKLAGPADSTPKVSLSDIAKRDPSLTSGTGGARRLTEPYKVTLQLNPDSADVKQAEANLDAFLKAPDWRAKAAHVSDGANILDILRDYYETRKGVDPTPGALKNRQRLRLDGTEILYYSYECASRHGNTIEAAMRRGPDGQFLLDWESFIGYSQMSWSEFKKQRPSSPQFFRAFAATSDYYNFEFADQQGKFLALNLLSPDGVESVHGYCERASELGTQLQELLGKREGTAGITVRLAFPENPESNHVVKIVELVSDRWLLLP